MLNTESQYSIKQAMAEYLDSVALARSANTARTYKNALQAFSQVLMDHQLDPKETPSAAITSDALAWLAAALKPYAPATERLYLTAVAGFYEYLAAERLADINLPRMRLLIRQRSRRPGQRLPQFPRENIEKVVDYAQTLGQKPAEDDKAQLRNLRDRAFLLCLADTGLRVHEA
jgi:site-specific recombinase XerD